ncbi:stage II sporulation protein M [Candidatus Woesearchaeota archaeon]|jgi:uncharacterized membrane protein SpoIIM required for sporulation|nr:stage II sporulation protein M [Candidatus Woesearchaeota archaeon]
MVLESILLNSQELKKSKIFLNGVLFSSIAVLLSLWIFRDFASLTMVFLTVFACLPFIYSTIKTQEQEDLSGLKESKLLKEHGKAITTFLFLFLGIVVSFALWYILLPPSSTTILFQEQTKTIININHRLAPNLIRSLGTLSVIFFNNLKVLIFCILFSFLYGAGAIFILTWNASVIGTAIGNFIRSHLSSIASGSGFTKAAAYFQIFSIGLMRYTIHGIPEILAYITAGLAGSIISVAVINHNFKTNKFGKILLDSSSLLIIALSLLAISAILEVYVTPIFFN